MGVETVSLAGVVWRFEARSGVRVRGIGPFELLHEEIVVMKMPNVHRLIGIDLYLCENQRLALYGNLLEE